MLNLKNLFEAGVHFGHLEKFKHPKMSKYIFNKINKMNIINLEKTVVEFEKSLKIINNIISNNGKILFVGTKKYTRSIVKYYAEKCNMPYVNYRWLGGILTNNSTIRNSIKKIYLLENKKKKDNSTLEKKDLYKIDKIILKLKEQLSGIKNMKEKPKALFILDTKNDYTAALEAKKFGIPTIGIVDTNCNPELITYAIPGNDDSIPAINLYFEIITKCILESKQKKII